MRHMKKAFNNTLNVDLADMMREQTGQRSVVHKIDEAIVKNPKPNDDEYRHCSFICSSKLWAKAQAIAHRENFSIRQVMEHWMQAGIESYESKNGEIGIRTTRTVEDAL